MKKILKVIFILFRSLLIFIVIGALSTACVKNTQKIILVEQFKSKGVYQEELSTNSIKYYKIESNEVLPAFTSYGKDALPGAPGDILVSTQATLINPFVSGFVSFFAGGHAAICGKNYQDYSILLNEYKSIESTGLNEGDNPTTIFDKSYWIYDDPFTEVIGLRVKMTEEQIDEVISLASSIIGDPYNYSFLFDTTNKSYCSDLVSKVYSYIGVDLNKDDFTTSIYDLIVSKDTYISYYHYFDNDGVKHIYYLD
ncbi:MAG: YiiX/YebB-like N1pC/P60 family cysteine hydrolase [Anaeroplasma sp.]